MHKINFSENKKFHLQRQTHTFFFHKNLPLSAVFLKGVEKMIRLSLVLGKSIAHMNAGKRIFSMRQKIVKNLFSLLQ